MDRKMYKDYYTDEIEPCYVRIAPNLTYIPERHKQNSESPLNKTL